MFAPDFTGKAETSQKEAATDCTAEAERDSVTSFVTFCCENGLILIKMFL